MAIDMAKRKAVPVPSPDEDAKSESVRVPHDMKRMVRWICKIEGIDSQVLMSQLCRDRLTSRFQPYESQVEQEEKVEREQKARLEALRRATG